MQTFENKRSQKRNAISKQKQTDLYIDVDLWWFYSSTQPDLNRSPSPYVDLDPGVKLDHSSRIQRDLQ